MKRIITLFSFIFVSTLMLAQKGPAGIRSELTTVEVDDKEYTLYTYKDKDEEGTFGYYLGLGMPDRLSSLKLRALITETSIYLGKTSEEAMATLDSIIAMFDKAPGETAEYMARTSKGETLKDTAMSTCTVEKKMIGKRLVFSFQHSSYTTETYLLKGAAKAIVLGFKGYLKLHPSAS